MIATLPHRQNSQSGNEAPNTTMDGVGVHPVSDEIEK